MTTKKILLFLLEGPSDKTTLENGFRDYVTSRYQNADITVDVARGDLSLKDKSDKHFASANKIDESISKHIGQYIKKRNLKATDICGVIHITDLDGCFCSASFFVEDSQYKKAHYDLENKCCKRADIDDLRSDRLQKAANVKQLIKTNYIPVLGFPKKYKIFYFSFDLEWVLYSKLNCTDDEKEKLSEDFEDEYNSSSAFENRIRSLPTVNVDYCQSWAMVERISKEDPFQPLTNVPLVFQLIDEIVAGLSNAKTPLK